MRRGRGEGGRGEGGRGRGGEVGDFIQTKTYKQKKVEAESTDLH
jgi:hypothetical protein